MNDQQYDPIVQDHDDLLSSLNDIFGPSGGAIRFNVELDGEQTVQSIGYGNGLLLAIGGETGYECVAHVLPENWEEIEDDVRDALNALGFSFRPSINVFPQELRDNYGKVIHQLLGELTVEKMHEARAEGILSVARALGFDHAGEPLTSAVTQSAFEIITMFRLLPVEMIVLKVASTEVDDDTKANIVGGFMLLAQAVGYSQSLEGVSFGDLLMNSVRAFEQAVMHQGIERTLDIIATINESEIQHMIANPAFVAEMLAQPSRQLATQFNLIDDVDD